MTSTKGIHHITAITADPQKNLDFYEGFLGQRLVKKTVNFDDPNAYHLYYGDKIGTPGTILTFFYWAGIPEGTRGVGEVSSLSYLIRKESFDFWKERANARDITISENKNSFGEELLVLEDPDGLVINLIAAQDEPEIAAWDSIDIPVEYSLLGFYETTLTVRDHAQLMPALTKGMGFHEIAIKDQYYRYESSQQPGKYITIKECLDLPPARQGAGSIHHIAFQADTDVEREQIKQQVNALGIPSTGLVDRQYFHSTYYMTPAAILFEIATNDIGFTFDESIEELGTQLQLPPQYESIRYTLEANLPQLSLPRDQH